MTAYELFSKAAVSAGCPKDQTFNLVRGGAWLQERQLVASAAARLCDHPNGPTAIGYGGARGGGKSHWMLAQMGIDDCQRLPGLKALLLRRVGKSNLEAFEDLRRRLFVGLPHEFKAHKGLLEFANGSRIFAGNYQTEADIDKYLGLEYDLIGIEETSQLTYRKYLDISTCCRTSKQNWRPRIYSTTNPGGVGHAWYRQKFVVPMMERRETDTRFIPARVTDNRWNNPDYVRVLESLTGWQKRAWLDGDWDIAAGQYFTNFRRDVHVLGDFDNSRAREWFAALDYGFAHYTVVLLACKDSDGNIHVVDEHAERMWLPERHCNAILAMLSRHGLTVASLARFVAGADVFGRQSDGATVAGQYQKFGIRLRVANMERQQGWATIMQHLGDPSGGIRPTLFIHRRCGRLIDTLPNLQHDPHRPEDVLKIDADDEGDGGDDAADALRYLVATKPRQLVARKLVGF